MTKKNSTKRIIKFLWNQRKVSPKLTWLMLFTQLLTMLLSSTVAPVFVSQLLTHIANGTATLKSDTWLLVFYAITLILSNIVLMRITIMLAYIVETKMQITTLKNILENLTTKSLRYHSNKMSGGIVSDANKLSGSVERFWDMLTFNITPIVTVITSTCLVLFFLVWQFALVLVILSIVIIYLIIKTQTSRTEYSEEVARKSSAVTAHFADVIGNISAVKAFGKEKQELNKYIKLNDDWRSSTFKEMRYNLISSISVGTVMNIMNIVAFAAAIIITENKIANIGIVYLVINYTLNVVNQLWNTSHATRAFLRIIGDSTPMINTLDEEIELTDPKNPEKLIVNSGEIKFDNIKFTHEKNGDPLFNNFSLSIKAGERIGLVGRSGAGKTSLTRLLLRFSDIDSGAILIDNQDISKVTQKNLRQNIAFVPQEPALFHRSIRENIAYSNLKASDKEVLAAAKKANALEFIEKLPNGLDTIVGERGVKLSGGQRQRIAIARAILKNAPILVLDEATSALDSESELLIQDALSKLMKGRTCIVVAHRLSTIAKLDRIVVINDGEIIEQGSHQELLQINGTYSKLWQHQSGGFIEE